jgi:hypothetical protein
MPTIASAALHNLSTIAILAYAGMNKGGDHDFEC